jgi:hypothetical protein
VYGVHLVYMDLVVGAVVHDLYCSEVYAVHVAKKQAKKARKSR